MVNSAGPRTDPCRTPQLICTIEKKTLNDLTSIEYVIDATKVQPLKQSANRL